MKIKTIHFVFIILGLITLKLSIEKHATLKTFDYHSEIWADKASYYVYLPSLYYYNFKADEFPDSIQEKTGNGFILTEDNKIETKVTYGVALLQSPFFILAHSLSGFLNQKSNGFTLIYHRSIDIAAVFYLMLGLYYLFKFLSFYFDKTTSFTTILVIFISTHLYQYSIDESGMSHIYSFSVISVLMYFLKKSDFLNKTNLKLSIIISLLSAFIILIRPTNLFILSAIFLFDIRNKDDLILRFKNIFNVKQLTILITSTIIVFIPQFIYWFYLSGNIIMYSYGNEGFNWLQPKIIEIVFSFENSLLLYTPIFILIIVSLFIKTKNLNNYIILFFLLLLIYIYSCWWTWRFGCSFGTRAFVDFTPLLAFSIGTIIFYISKKNFIYKAMLTSVIVVFSILNLKLSNNYDKCFHGQSEWDLKEYKRLITE